MNLRSFFRSRFLVSRVTAFALVAAVLFSGSASADVWTVALDVDATEISRHLLRSRIVLPAQPGMNSFWFPKWIPGIHGPGQQVKNLAGFVVKTSAGQPLSWTRDDADLCKFHVEVPEGQNVITIDMTYLANQPTTLSRSVDSYGDSNITVINFNTCLLYPDGASARELIIKPRLKLPADWRYATSLADPDLAADANVAAEEWLEFQPLPLRDLVDSPVIAGPHYARLDTPVDNFPPVRFHFIAEEAGQLELREGLAEQLQHFIQEAAAMFGGAPFDRYEFLVHLSDKIPGMGLEHVWSSLNGVDEDGLTSETSASIDYLLPHELVHAWCGKYRRPGGMFRDDFHTTKKTKLLWIYEGLTQYLGQVLTARSGLVEYDEAVDRLAGRVGYLVNRQGRNWRSLEDTATSGYLLRGGSNNWPELRRSQDYYDEGALFWLEADAIIRDKTNGQHSLDDFCHEFFAADSSAEFRIKPYALSEPVAILNRICPFDWEGLIDRRIRQPQDQLSLEVFNRLGYQFTYSEDQPDYLKHRESDREYLACEHSIGATINTDSKRIGTVIPDSPADQAGLAGEIKIMGVNGKTFTKDRLVEAIRDSPETGEIRLLMLDGDSYAERTIKYDQGLRYPVLEPVEGQKNLLAEIWAPRTDAPVTEAKPDETAE